VSKKLIITEKPSVARDFARVLKVSGNNNGYIENNEYVISWCYGHLVEMVYPEVYNEIYKVWRLEDLPFLPEEYKYGVIESARNQYEIVNSLLHRQDIDTVYWAGDSGKEGQTIEENIRNYGGVRDGMTELRVWIDSQTDEEILRGIREAKPMSDYALLGKSGIMRTIEDYSLGINFSRALSVKYGRMINDAAATSSYTAIAIGRVMTCVLGMVVNREREIRNFVETPFFRITGSFSDVNFNAEWKAVEGSRYFNSPLLYKENGFKKKETAEQLISELQGKDAVINQLESGTSKKRAPLLFNLAELQSECSKIFKISPNQALDIAQELYEKKLTTYPRTDARVLSTAIAKEIAKNIYGLQKYAPLSSFAKEITDGKKYIGIDKTAYTDDKKVTDHYAIIPTGQVAGIDNLSPLAKSVYELIAKRFLSIFYPPAEYKTVKIQVEVDKEMFFTSAKALTSPGYMKVTGIPQPKEQEDSEGQDKNISKEELISLTERFKEGDIISANGYEIKEGKTSPPKRYTSGTLILAMENAGNLIEDEELREQIKKSGIGTSATRGEILEKLVRIKYLNLNTKTQIISPENLGEMIYEVVALSVPTLLIPEMTANWEMGLEGIINGTVDDMEYRRKLEDYIRHETNKMISVDLTHQIASNINQFTGKESKGIATRKPLGINCPVCGGELNKTSFGYGCSNYFNEQTKCKFGLGQVAGVDIPEEQFIKLIKEGKTDVISGFTGKSKNKFSAILKLAKDDAGQVSVVFDFDGTPQETLDNISCPVCGGNIVKTSYGFTCENHFNETDKCYFSIGEIAGRKTTEEDLRSLINDGITDVLTGFKTKSKVPFVARLKLADGENGRKEIQFSFDGITPDILKEVKCPDCGGDIYIKTNGYSCSNYNPSDETSCKFYIGRTIASKNISEAVATELIKNGKTETIRGFKGKSGKPFDACLVLKKNEQNHTEILFDFDSVEQKVLENVTCPDCGGPIVIKQNGFGCKNFDSSNPESCRFYIGKIAGKQLTKGDVTELLSNGTTKTIRGFKGKTGKSFDAVLVLKKNEAGKSEIAFDFDNVEAKSIKDVVCPVCGGSIVKTPFGYGCSNYNKDDPEHSCTFNIGKIAGLAIKESYIKELLTDGVTSEISGFKSKTGNKFNAKLELSKDETGNVTGIRFLFENESEIIPDILCPKCQGKVIKDHFGYHCEKYSKEEGGCDFYIGKIAGVSIEKEQFIKLLKERKTDLITGFLSKKGVFFDARLKLDEENKIQFDFEQYSQN